MDTNVLKENLDDSYSFIRTKTDSKPKIGIILGTGLEDLAKKIESELVIPYTDIPHFPISTVDFHKGQLIFGKLSNKEVVAMQGRFHYYEGYTLNEITFPVRIMKMLGVKILIISNACGSMNPSIKARSIMLIDDHINLLGNNPLIGLNDDTLGPRFVDMSEPYSKRLIGMVEGIASDRKINIQKGVYVAMSGPSLETRAEYKFLRMIGADVVGMSTVPENIVARQLGMEVLGLSVITDECDPMNLKPVDIKEILYNASFAEPDLTTIIIDLIKDL